MPPKVQYSWVEGSGPKVSRCSLSAVLRRWSRIRPGSTRASRCLESMSSIRFRYLEKSITTAVLAVGAELGPLRHEDAVEEERLDAHMVVEVLEMAEVADGAEGVRGELWRAVP